MCLRRGQASVGLEGLIVDPNCEYLGGVGEIKSTVSTKSTIT